MNYKKNAIAAALFTSLGMGAAAKAEASIITATWSGLFTLLNASGVALQNNSYPYYGDPIWGYGMRTQISGTMAFDTSTGAGTATINGFDFFASGPPFFHDVSVQAIGDGFGGSGSLVAGKMLFDWKGNNNISVGIILDAAGFFGSGPVGTSAVISGVGATPASDGISGGKYPIGPAPMVTSSLDTNFMNNPTCYLTASCITGDDGVGGTPMDNGNLLGFSANFDITSIHIDSVTVSAVPVPTAVWLFGSGLIGLVGVARHRKQRYKATTAQSNNARS